MNKVIIVGNLGSDPELRTTASGQAVCTLSVATTRRWTGKDGQSQEETEWHRVVVWGRQAENCNQYLKKGRQVLIEGRIQTRQWEDKDGNKRYTTEIVAQNVQFLGGGVAVIAQEPLILLHLPLSLISHRSQLPVAEMTTFLSRACQLNATRLLLLKQKRNH